MFIEGRLLHGLCIKIAMSAVQIPGVTLEQEQRRSDHAAI